MAIMERLESHLEVTAGTTVSSSEGINKSGTAGMRVYIPSTSSATIMSVYGKLRDEDDYVLCQDADENDADGIVVAAARIPDVTKYVYGVTHVKIVLNSAGLIVVLIVS